eukprot:m.227710 g.227710  ORF g.227710 m.227710 type:complete len:121 (-) comp17294_c0_seq1:29-391(-)
MAEAEDRADTAEEPAPAPITVVSESVLVKFRAAGGAPQLLPEKKKIKCKTILEFKVIADHLRKLLLLERADASLFLYVSTNHVSPSLDETLANLTLLYGRSTAKGACELEVAYALTPAWG